MAEQGSVPGGPLDGIRVLEFSQIVAAPVCGVNLSDLGAEVIKVEPPGGEQTRRGGSVVPNESKGFQALNRGKLGLVVDLQDERGRDVIHRLVSDIDVVVINYRLGVAERIGIGYETLAAIRPDLIYWQNTGFGDEGPGAYRAGSDIVSQAYSGFIAGDGKMDDDGAPDYITATALADVTTGFAAAMGISAALFHRERTGEGQFLTTSLLRTGLFMQAGQVMREPVHDAVIARPGAGRGAQRARQRRILRRDARGSRTAAGPARRLPALLRRVPRQGRRSRARRSHRREPSRHAPRARHRGRGQRPTRI